MFSTMVLAGMCTLNDDVELLGNTAASGRLSFRLFAAALGEALSERCSEDGRDPDRDRDAMPRPPLVDTFPAVYFTVANKDRSYTTSFKKIGT